jgi:hypothetical protein
VSADAHGSTDLHLCHHSQDVQPPCGPCRLWTILGGLIKEHSWRIVCRDALGWWGPQFADISQGLTSGGCDGLGLMEQGLEERVYEGGFDLPKGEGTWGVIGAEACFASVIPVEA